jgi:RimJ/RimL family protein N-acetyltransferase
VISASDIELRVSSIVDFKLMCDIELNPESQNYTTLQMPDVNDIRAFLSYGQDLQLNGQIRYTIEYKGQGVGFIDLTNYIIDQQTADVGIIILPEYRRMNLAFGALNRLIDIAKRVQVSTLKAYVKQENSGSLSLFAKAGYSLMKQEAEYFIYVLKLSF